MIRELKAHSSECLTRLRRLDSPQPRFAVALSHALLGIALSSWCLHVLPTLECTPVGIQLCLERTCLAPVSRGTLVVLQGASGCSNLIVRVRVRRL